MGIVQTVPIEPTCSACTRIQYVDGLMLTVEAAVSPEKIAETVGQLADLRDSRNARKRQRYYDLVERLEQLAAYGELEQPREMRQLDGELWELKTAEDRVPFHTVAARENHKKAVRLTHLFSKVTGKTQWGTTPRKHIVRGLWIVKGDKDHG